MHLWFVCVFVCLFVCLFSDLDSHLPSRDDVGDDVFRRRVRVDPVRPLADGDHVAALLKTTKKPFNTFSDFFGAGVNRHGFDASPLPGNKAF